MVNVISAIETAGFGSETPPVSLSSGEPSPSLESWQRIDPLLSPLQGGGDQSSNVRKSETVVPASLWGGERGGLMIPYVDEGGALSSGDKAPELSGDLALVCPESCPIVTHGEPASGGQPDYSFL